jgi:hypothetical protein
MGGGHEGDVMYKAAQDRDGFVVPESRFLKWRRVSVSSIQRMERIRGLLGEGADWLTADNELVQNGRSYENLRTDQRSN